MKKIYSYILSQLWTKPKSTKTLDTSLKQHQVAGLKKNLLMTTWFTHENRNQNNNFRQPQQSQQE